MPNSGMHACRHQLQQVDVAHLHYVCSKPGLIDEFLVGWYVVIFARKVVEAYPLVHTAPSLTLFHIPANFACSSSRRGFSSPTASREYFLSSRRSVFPWSRSHSPRTCVARQSAVRKYIPTATETHRNSFAVRALMSKHQTVGRK